MSSVLIVTLALAIAPYFIGLGSSTLWDSNEAFYAETPREMIESGDWVNPSFNFKPRFNKPPLCYWVVAGLYEIFGVSEAIERVAIVFGAIAMIFAAYTLGRAGSSVNAGLLSAITLAASPRFLMFSRRIIIDVYVSGFMSLTLVCFVLAELHPKRRRIFLSLMYVMAALGTLTKGPVALLLPGMSFIAYLAASRRWRDLRSLMLPAGAVLIALIVVPWYVAVYLQHGWSYIESFLIRDNLSRFAEPVWGPQRGVLFYLPVFLGDLLPWSVFLVPALWFAVRRTTKLLRGPTNSIAPQERADENERVAPHIEQQPRVEMLLLIWLVVIVGFFSLSRNKEDLYIMPAYPAAAAIVGNFLVRFFSKDELRSAGRVTLIALASLIGATGFGLIYLLSRSASVWNVNGTNAIAATLLSGALVTGALLLWKRQAAALMTTGVTVLLLNMLVVVKSLPDFERFKPVRELCKVVSAEATTDSLVGYYRFACPSMVFYLKRPIFEYYKTEELYEALTSERPVYCIMSAADYDSVRHSLPVPTYVLASRPAFQVKLKSFLEGTQAPQIMLVSNRGNSGT